MSSTLHFPRLVLLAASLGAAHAAERWPGGKGKGSGSPGDWAALLKNYGFRDEAEALGGTIVVIHKPGDDDHPHGLDHPQPIVDFVLEHAR